MPRRATRPLAAALALACAGCPLDPRPLPGTGVTYHDVPYDGVAFPDRRTPLSVPPAGLAIVADTLSDTLSVVDPTRFERIASLPVGRDPLGIDGPAGLAVDLPRGALHVALSYPVKFVGAHAGHEGHGADPGYVQRLALSDLSVQGETAIDAEATAIALSEDGKRLVVTHLFEAGLAAAAEDPTSVDLARARITVVSPDAIGDPAAPDPGTIRVCLGATGVALSRPDAARAYVACSGEDAIAIADLDHPEAPVTRVPLGSDAGPPGSPAIGPYAVALSPDGSLLAVASTLSGDIRFVDLVVGALIKDRTVSVEGRPRRLAFSADGARLLVPVQGPDAAVALDPATGAEIARHDFAPGACASPEQVVDGAHGSLYVVCAGTGSAPGSVVQLVASTLEPSASATVGLQPSALALVPGSGP